MDIPIFLTIAIPLLTGLTFIAYRNPKGYKIIFQFLAIPLIFWAGFNLGVSTSLPPSTKSTGNSIFWMLLPNAIFIYLFFLTILPLILQEDEKNKD